MLVKKYTPIIVLCGFFACHHIKTKEQAVAGEVRQVVASAKQKLKERKDSLLDKIYPTYDYDRPDTKNNTKRFIEHLQVDTTKDVKNIYAYGDFLGIDYKVLMAFTCNKSTINKIVLIKKMNLSIEQDDDGLFFADEFKWWDKSKIASLKPYKVGQEYKYWEYLWYDETTGKAYYEEFSL